MDLLCGLVLLGCCLLPVCRTRVYTNHWAVKIAGGFPEANRIASKYGFINIGQVTTEWPALGPEAALGRGGFPSTSRFLSPSPPLSYVLLQLLP